LNPRSSSLGYASRILRAVSGSVASQAVSFLAIPFVFRLYAPGDFALWASLQTATLIVSVVATLRLEFALVKERDEDQASRLFWICLLGGSAASLVIAGLLLAGLALFAGAHALLSGPQTLIALAWLLSQVAFQGVFNWLLRVGRFGLSSSTILVSGLVTNLTQIGLALVPGGGRDGLLIGSALGLALGAVFGAFAMRGARPGPPVFDPKAWARAVSEHRRFALYTLPYTLLTQVRERAGLFVLAGYAPAAAVGRYSQAFRLTGLPGLLSGAAFRPVVFHEAARSGVAEVEPLVLDLMGLATVAITPFIGVLMADPDHLARLVLGARWAEAGPIAAALAPAAYLFALTNWMDRLFDVGDRHEVNLVLELITAVGSIAVFWAALALGRPLLEAALMQGGVLVLAYLFKAAAVFRLSGFRLARLGAILAAAAGLAALGGLATWAGAQVGGAGAGLAAGLVCALMQSLAGAVWLARRALDRAAREGPAAAMDAAGSAALIVEAETLFKDAS
jgi:O-antigen/teichoic acid export membrane protein